MAANAFSLYFNSAQVDSNLTATQISGTVSAGGKVAAIEQVISLNGEKKFVWSYVYEYTLNGKEMVSPLLVCVSDLVVE